ncbi:probable U3 small nucleolar RNA-associated protein 11 [Acanthaster planci]|uniref:U3 small nucleolar RNA-associated protein 11 n=1 Tax=Acanthaster planci TaxID=133434 RepID=A0A8B7YY07_ACAPL|nr:probable U3 small nucleolar RNA-associated protein 11 [Acanthaster planci]
MVSHYHCVELLFFACHLRASVSIMSSFKKAAKSAQKTYKERSQPASRHNLGLLEKKKDYKLRAKDYHEKQNKLKKLRRKALFRNPDEFYFKMVSSRLEDGVHKRLKKEETVTAEQEKLMATQDKKYVNYKLAVETKKIEKLRSTLHLVEEVTEKPQNKHIFFVDTKEEVDSFDITSHLGKLQSATSPPLDETSEDILEMEKAKKYRELSQRKKRQKELKIIGDKMEARTLKKDKRRKVLVKGETQTASAVYKFYPERKR